MIRFLLKGILRDKSRSILPIAVVAIGVGLTVILSGYMRGYMDDLIRQSARFQTGHLKVLTRAYEKNMDQLPLDLALLGVDSIMAALKEQYPDVEWVKRINFGGLIDVPDENGTTKGQGPASGMALSLLTSEGGESKRIDIRSALVRGSPPTERGDAVIGQQFSEKLNVKIGDQITYMGSTMNGSMTLKNFRVGGIIHFGMTAMDRGTVIIDVSDAQEMFDLQDGAGEILGFFNGGVYIQDRAASIAESFNAVQDKNDEFAPTMITLREQNNLGSYIDMTDMYAKLFVGIFVFSMSLVLWNTGLLSGLRRYQEFGIRLALGESKGTIYRNLIGEAVLVGSVGSIVGTGIGIAITLYIQYVGIDVSSYTTNSTLMMSSVLRSKFTPDLLYLGFVPGLFAMVVGSMLAGIGIYKRETAVLFKELEV